MDSDRIILEVRKTTTAVTSLDTHLVSGLNDIIGFTTSSNVLAGATFSSGVLDIREYRQVQTNIVSDQDGTINIYWYDDSAGSTLVRTVSIPYLSANGFQMFSAPTFSRYVMYDFVNTTIVNTTSFVFQTKFLKSALSAQVLGVEATLLAPMVANLDRSVIVAKDILGNYTNVRSDYNGNLKTAQQTDTFSEVALAFIYDTYGDRCIIKPKTLFKFGKNPDLDATVKETIWGTGGDEVYCTDNLINRIVSTSALDTYAVKIEGHTVTGTGVNAQYTFVVQEITLNGTTPVALTTPLARISLTYNNSDSLLVGTVTVFESVATTVHMTIIAGEQNGEKCSTTFSNSDYGIITQLTGGNSSKTSALLEFELEIRNPGKIFRRMYRWGVATGSVSINLNPYIVIPKNSDVRIRAVSNTNNTEGFASFNCLFGLVQ